MLILSSGSDQIHSDTLRIKTDGQENQNQSKVGVANISRSRLFPKLFKTWITMTMGETLDTDKLFDDVYEFMDTIGKTQTAVRPACQNVSCFAAQPVIFGWAET
ncbi:hypothetical protein RRG08_027113 [Elysia crispata]|uniref:Uncharacterized protein n=1 Tax=Elysia crispata TaxID=231223 RepID=A0AAE0YXV0_9GAST|nr:hypothetical protein RRG08_027113 [Elysia crispata]